MLVSGNRSNARALEAVHDLSTVFDSPKVSSLVNGGCECPRWWLLNLSVTEIAGNTITSPRDTPTSNEFNSAGMSRSMLYCRVSWSPPNLGSKVVRFDVAGGGRYSFYGDIIDVSIFSATTEPIRTFKPTTPQEAATGARVTWTNISGTLEPQRQTLGPQFGRFTVRQVIGSNAAGPTIDIPEDATRVQIFEAADGAVTNQTWTFLGFDGAMELGEVALTGGSSSIAFIPNGATQMIVAGPPVGRSRTYSIVFDQEW